MSRSRRNLWKAFIEGRAAGSSSSRDPSGQTLRLAPFQGMVLGLDPSLRATGVAVVEFRAHSNPVLLEHETIRVPAARTMPECLARIAERIEAIAHRFPLKDVAVEQTIYVQNYRTAMILGAAKGAAVSVLARRGLPVYEYPPLRVKQAVVGSGRARKEQVAAMVTQILNYSEWNGADETDAAGVALCHGFSHRLQS